MHLGGGIIGNNPMARKSFGDNFAYPGPNGSNSLSGQRSGFCREQERTVDKYEWEVKSGAGGGQSSSPTPQRTGKKQTNNIKANIAKKNSKQ